MDALQFTLELTGLLRTDVPGLSADAKSRLVREQLKLWEADRQVLEHRIAFVPFVPGRRPRDEVLRPGLGSSENVCVIGPYDDGMVCLYRLTHAGDPLSTPPDGARLVATMELLDQSGQAIQVVPGWDGRDVEAQRLPGSGPASALALVFNVNDELASLAGPGVDDPFGFASMFSERFRLRLEMYAGGTVVAGDTITFDAFDAGRLGGLYERISATLLPLDMRRQCQVRSVEELPVNYHPWFPVLCIGSEKARRYLRAIVGDVAGEKRMFTDPGWLLRVGLNLELLTCLGIFEAVRPMAGDLLSADERRALEEDPRLAEVRRRMNPAAWSAVWERRQVAFGSGPGKMPVAFANLLRKKEATFTFLRAHHEDLKHAIELAGPNRVNAQETWHRVFRDAERAVLKMNEEAFPELQFLVAPARELVLWHQRGTIGPLRLAPKSVTGAFGDQDGLFPSACRQYRESMNRVARWAEERGLMEYTGEVCIPPEVSILESMLAKDPARLSRLQHRDGYEGDLQIRERPVEERGLSPEEVAATLSRVRMFEVFEQDELFELARKARPIELGPHERIIVQGNAGSSVFVLHEGELEVVLKKTDGKMSSAQLLGPGAVVGEFSFLTGEPRSATVRATDGALVVELAAADLQPLVRSRPALLDSLTDVLARRQEDNRAERSRSKLFTQVSGFLLGQPR